VQDLGGFGAGDLLLALLPIALTHTGFRIYQQRAQLLRPRTLGACLGCVAFSLASTAAVVKALGITAGGQLGGSWKADAHAHVGRGGSCAPCAHGCSQCW
jgi:hypothetical protein